MKELKDLKSGEEFYINSKSKITDNPKDICMIVTDVVESKHQIFSNNGTVMIVNAIADDTSSMFKGGWRGFYVIKDF